MKKMVPILLTMVILISCSTILAQAKTGDVIGSALHTDIVVYINNYAIPSYAVNGQSAIVAEDLRNFGFDVIWDNYSRSLTINRNSNPYVKPMQVEKGYKTGSHFTSILETDIKVWALGRKLTSYAINGYTMIPAEELTMFGTVTWKENERALKIELDNLEIRESMQAIEKVQTTIDYSVFNGNYIGGGVYIPGERYAIGRWSAVLDNVTENSLNLNFGQSESDYSVSMVLYRQENGSYYGKGYSTWDAMSYITIWLESPQTISLTVSGSADSVGTEKLYRSNSF